MHAAACDAPVFLVDRSLRHVSPPRLTLLSLRSDFSMGIRYGILAFGACAILWGCGEEKTPDPHAGHDHSHEKSAVPIAASPELAKIIVTTGSPDHVTGVAMARKDAKAGDSIAMIGRVKDFVK